MNFLDGYDYRINIVGEDSSVIVDSYTGIIKGRIANKNEDIILDPYTATMRASVLENANEHGIKVGSLQSPASLEFDITNLNINSYIKYTDSSLISLNVHYTEINLDSTNLVNILTCKVLHNNKHRKTVEFGVCSDNKLPSSNEPFPSIFFLKTYDGVKENDPVYNDIRDHKESLTFGRNTLSAPIFKVGAHRNVDQLEAEKGMIVFNDKTKKFQGYTGKRWVDLH
jgi:hypothetical protein